MSTLPSEQINSAEMFVDRYSSSQYNWYEKQAERYEKGLTRWTWLSFLFGFLATAVAAYPSERLGQVEEREILRWAVVILSAAATLSAGTLVPRYQALYKAREAGRVKTALVMNLARIELEAAKDEEKCLRIKTKFIRDLMAVEGVYGTIAASERDNQRPSRDDSHSESEDEKDNRGKPGRTTTQVAGASTLQRSP